MVHKVICLKYDFFFYEKNCNVFMELYYITQLRNRLDFPYFTENIFVFYTLFNALEPIYENIFIKNLNFIIIIVILFL